MYLLNNSFKAIGSFNLSVNQRSDRDNMGGDRLFRNDEGKFVDVSEEAGIYGSEIGFGLGVTVADISNDGIILAREEADVGSGAASDGANGAWLED